MHMLLRGLLVAVIFVSAGVCPPAAVAQEQGDDGSRPMEALETEPPVARYLVTFIKSRITDSLRSATVVSVTNQAEKACQVSVQWVRGFMPPAACTTTVRLDPGTTGTVAFGPTIRLVGSW
jgi:hypothetical protein